MSYIGSLIRQLIEIERMSNEHPEAEFDTNKTERQIEDEIKSIVREVLREDAER